MRYLLLLTIAIAFASCDGDNATSSDTTISDSAAAAKADSLKEIEEDVSEELIHGAFNELNRDALGR